MNYKRIVLSMFMLLGMAVWTKAQNGTLTLKLRPGEVMMETTELQQQELAALNAIGLLSMEVEYGWHDYCNADNKRLLSIDVWSNSESLLQTAEDVSSTDNIVRELTADDNFTYLLNEDDLAAFADWLYQGDGRGNIMVNDCFRYVKSITMAFDVPSGVRSLISNPSQSDEAWYTLDGRKLSGVPTKPGVYVVGGRKILIGNKR